MVVRTTCGRRLRGAIVATERFGSFGVRRDVIGGLRRRGSLQETLKGHNALGCRDASIFSSSIDQAP